MTPGDIERNYNESFYFLNQRKIRQVNQLVLLNNLNRGDQNIASTLLLTLFNRLVSNSYDDKLQVKFLPSQGILQEQLNSYNMLAQSDYQEMEKSRLDYDWIWDTLFFGRGYCETLKFDRKRKIMQPHIINPLVFQYDPYFENPSQWRYYSKWIFKSKAELQKLIAKGRLLNVTSVDELPSGIDPYIWAYKIKRDEAKKVVQPPIQPYSNDVYMILEYFGYDEDGDKCVYWIDRNFSTILLHEKLDLKDGEPIVLPDGTSIENDSRWPIVVKEAFREPHSSVNFSVADLLEDKHRAKSVLLNLAYIAAKDKANPIYWYDPEKVTNVAQLLSRQVNQHIQVEGDGRLAIGPLNTQEPMTPELLNFISLITQEADEPLGTGNLMQPHPGKKQTATEAALTQQMSDMATSLQSKVMQFGEKEFWSHWFARYRKEGKNLGVKMANIVGVKGITTQEIDLSDFQVKFPPGVMVYSAKEAEYKEMVDRKDLMQIYPQLIMSLGPEGMRNFNKHVFFPKLLQDPSLIDVMLPKTLDEMKAEQENEQLAKNILPQVTPDQNHETHIFIHSMLQPKTWAVWLHIKEHEVALQQQKMAQQVAGSLSNPLNPPKINVSLKGDISPTVAAEMVGGNPSNPQDVASNEQMQAMAPKSGQAPKQAPQGAKSQGSQQAATPLKGAMQANLGPQTNVNQPMNQINK